MSRRIPSIRRVARTLLPLVAGTALVLGLATAPASAGTATNGPLTITATDQALQPGCYEYQNITYSVAHPYHWSLDVNVLKGSTVGDSDFTYGDGPGSGPLGDYLCETPDGPGTYTVRAVLTPYDSAYNEQPKVEATTSFVLSAPPAVATHMTITASPKTTRYNNTVEISGQVHYTDPATSTEYAADGLTVTLAQRFLGTQTWTTVATGVTAGLQPTFDFTRTAQRNAEYRVTFEGDQSYLASSAAVTVHVRRLVSGRILEPREHVFFFAGKVKPAYAGKRVYLMRQRCPSCAYRTYSSQRTTRTSTYRFALPRPSKGSFHFKVRVPGDVAYLVSFSPEWRLTRLL